MDFIYLIEGTVRGSSPLWHYPIIGAFLYFIAFILAIYPFNLIIFLLLPIIIIITFINKIKTDKKWKIHIKENIINIVSTIIITILFISLLPMWSIFISD